MTDNWEKAVIGTALADTSTISEAEELLPSDFTGVNQIVWAELLGLYNNGGVDLRALQLALEQTPDWRRYVSDAGNPSDYLAEVYAYRGTTMQTYAGKVLDASVKRSVKRAAALIAASSEDENTEASELIDYAENEIMKLRRGAVNKGVTIADILHVFIPRLERMRAGTFQPAWVPEAVGVRNQIDFMEQTDFFVVAGRPGEGKSSYLRYEAYHAAMRGKSVALFNLENDPIEYARYMISLKTGIDSKLLRNATRLTPQQVDAVKVAAAELAALPVHIVTMGAPSAREVVRSARRLISEHDVSLIMLDYIQLVRNGVENTNHDVAMTTGVLRGFNLNAGVPLIAACQLNRAIETRGEEDSDPKLSDLRDSGSIEQDATIVGFIRSAWRRPSPAQIGIFPENRGPNGQNLPNPVSIPVRMHVAKHRNGTIGKTDIMKWVKPTGVFQTLEPGFRL